LRQSRTFHTLANGPKSGVQFRRQHTHRSFTRKLFGDGADRRVVEDQYLKAPKHLPNCLVIVRSAGVTKVITQSPHEGPHVVIAGARPVQSIKKGLGRAELSRPLERILVRAINLSRGAASSDRQLVPPGPEVRFFDSFRDLLDDLLEDDVAWRKRNAPLDLNLKRRCTASRVFVRVEDHIIQRKAVVGALKFDTIDGRAGKAPRLRMSEHREEVVSTDLALETSTCRSL
jgi:hypothetical protein